MSKIKNIEFVQDITPEAAETYSGGVTLTDVTLTSEFRGAGTSFRTNIAIEDLSDFGFDNSTQFIAINNSQTWRFYSEPNFEGDYIDIGPNTATNVSEFGLEISSLQAIT